MTEEEETYAIDDPEEPIGEFDDYPEEEWEDEEDEEDEEYDDLPKLSLTVPPCDALKKASREMPEELGHGDLYMPHTNTYCAIGWLAHCAGASDEELRALDDDLRNCDLLYLQIADYFGVDYSEYFEMMYFENDRAQSYERNEVALLNYAKIAKAIGCDLEVQ